MRTQHWTALVAAVALLVVSGCGGGGEGKAGKTSEGVGLLRDGEATTVLTKYLSKRLPEGETADRTPPSSVAEAEAILRNDEVSRFDPAVDFLVSRKGDEARALQVSLELFHAELLRRMAAALERQAGEKEELKAHLEGKVEQGLTIGDDDKAVLEGLPAQLKEDREVIESMRILSVEHLLSGERIATALAKSSPKSAAAHLGLAHLHLLKGDWAAYDESLATATELAGEPGFRDEYLRAVEPLERAASMEKTREHLSKLCKDSPEHVRPLATMLLTAMDEESAGEDLEKLREKSSAHPAAAILGEWLERKR